ncbi:GNAT family N-acetyltransferase [Catenulispora pinisilvae]|uniref:GNAT family N-acetyltransferase n=2 Tax=Catenulispora pinisilvae TaxID=2705253 RepID=UPI001890E4A7|nr:GNAT family N-acetyltransferase [Catenulispora pinisilvae]
MAMTLTLSVDPTPDAPALFLRPWREPDLPTVVAAYQDPAMRRWLSVLVDGEAEARAWLERQARRWVDGSRLSFAVEERGRVVGHFVVKGADVAAGSETSVGYWTLADARGRGIASRCVERVSDWLFGPQELVPAEVVELVHSVGNAASCRVAEKCGYALAATIPARPPQFPDEGHRHVRNRP